MSDEIEMEMEGGWMDDSSDGGGSFNSSSSSDDGTPSIPVVDDLILRLMTTDIDEDDSNSATEAAVHVLMGIDELTELCKEAALSLSLQASLLRIGVDDLPLVICGDLHGQFRDLRGIFRRCGSPVHQAYLFLGDYVDRGKLGIETMSLLLALKVKYPTKVFLLRGNHECGAITRAYGFYEECRSRYGDFAGEQVFQRYVAAFNMLPAAALVAGRILCMHGGLSPHLHSLQDIERIRRPCEVPPHGLLCDLLWADPDDSFEGWATSGRGMSYTFSASVVADFCHRLGLDLIVRAHQLTRAMFNTGYDFFAGGRLLTLFSAPNYMNLRNDACVLVISSALEASFVVFRGRRPPPSSRSTRSQRPRSRRSRGEKSSSGSSSDDNADADNEECAAAR